MSTHRFTHSKNWPFDRARNVACVTDAGLLEGAPILLAIHYSDDHSWAFLSGEPFDPKRGKLISMGSALTRDATLREVADLPPGWVAERSKVEGPWARKPDPEM